MINPFEANVPIIQKPINRFKVQIKIDWFLCAENSGLNWVYDVRWLKNSGLNWVWL